MSEKKNDGLFDTGLLLLRVPIGAIFFYVHGLPRLFGGVQEWQNLGIAMKSLGVEFMPIMWGFLAAICLCAGGLMLVLGLFIRWISVLLAFTMLIAIMQTFHIGQGLPQSAHAITASAVFLAFVFLGAGKYSLDGYLKS